MPIFSRLIIREKNAPRRLANRLRYQVPIDHCFTRKIGFRFVYTQDGLRTSVFTRRKPQMFCFISIIVRRQKKKKRSAVGDRLLHNNIFYHYTHCVHQRVAGFVIV